MSVSEAMVKLRAKGVLDSGRLWTTGNGKIRKATLRQYHASILHLAPAETARRGRTVCPFAENCKGPCLNTAGRVALEDPKHSKILDARKARTLAYFDERDAFLTVLGHGVERALRRARAKKMRACFRPNGTSDLVDVPRYLATRYPTVQFYDYTKVPKPWLRTRENYHLTFSYDGPHNWGDCVDALAHGVNVAVVFRVCNHRSTCHCPLPAEWQGFSVFDGDKDDLRFLDPTGVIVGLRAKGRARRPSALRSGFTVDMRRQLAA